MACRLRLKFKLINILNEMDFILQKPGGYPSL